MSFHNRFSLIVAMLFLLLVGDSCSSRESSQDAQLPVVTVTSATNGIVVQSIPVNGTLVPMPNYEAVIRPPFAGIVSRIDVAPNQKVTKGEILAEMSTQLLKGEVEQAKAQIVAGKLQVNQARADAVQQRATTSAAIAQAETGLHAAQATLVNAQQNFARQQRLFHDGIVSQKNVQDADLAAKTAEAAEKAQQEAVKAARATKETERVKEAEIAVAQQHVESAEGALSRTLAQLSLSTIRSPLSGAVATVTANNGEMVDPSSPLLTIVDTGKLQLVAGIRSRDLTLVHAGDPVTFTTDSMPGKTFFGVVKGIGAQVDPTTGTIPATVLVENNSHLLKDDMVAAGAIIVGRHTGLLIPKSAVLTDPATTQTTVVVVGSDGVAHVVPVIVGFPSGNKVEIKKGLKAGDRVAVGGQYAMPDGTKVKVIVGKGS